MQVIKPSTISYVFQIQANLAGHKGSPIQPLAAAINCTLWVIYGLFKKERDWALSIANMPETYMMMDIAVATMDRMRICFSVMETPCLKGRAFYTRKAAITYNGALPLFVYLKWPYLPS